MAVNDTESSYSVKIPDPILQTQLIDSDRRFSPDNRLSHQYNFRPCPQCSLTLFGMPGGRDATCTNCGFKDPCCSD